nr:hypothetical protein [Fodinicola feengrottensis]
MSSKGNRSVTWALDRNSVSSPADRAIAAIRSNSAARSAVKAIRMLPVCRQSGG